MTHAAAVATHAVERYLLDEMTELERHRFEEHYFGCQECAADLRGGTLMREGVAAGMLGPAAAPAVKEPATVTPFRPRKAWSPSVVLPWAAAAMLALAVGYQSLFVVPGLRDQLTAPQVLSPVTLRAASRGAEPQVRRSSGPTTFALDLSGVQAGTRLTYDLRTAGGDIAATGSAEAPSPGTPLLLLIPGTAFAAPGSYVLTVRADGPSGPATTDFRFTVTDN
jgi:hypothetical protein